MGFFICGCTDQEVKIEEPESPDEGEVEVEVEIEIPTSINLDIPFQSQAPHANWDMPYQEGCEEASIILAVKYLEDINYISAEEMNQEILDMVDYQNKNYGGHYDLSAEETSDLLLEYYGDEFETELIYDFEWEDVKKALAQDHPVIIPTAGQQLGNPYYTAPGPRYHMMVIRGYDENYVYTNDVGTKRGENYKYDYNTLYNGVHDWNNGNVESGEKVMIVVK